MRLSRKMLLNSAIFGVLLAGTAQAKTEGGSSGFQHYKRIEVNGGAVLIDPSLRHHTVTVDEKFSELLQDDFGNQAVRVDCGKLTVEIGFSPGPSEDPTYGIVVHNGKKILTKSVPADSFIMSSSCQFYARGHTNNSFDMRRKFVITEKVIKETEQPLYLVDKTCPTSAPATLTTEKCGRGTVVATIPKGSDVRIIASEWLKSISDSQQISSCGEGKESYLVATPFGLVGWVENVSGDIYGHPGQPLSCIFVNGD